MSLTLGGKVKIKLEDGGRNFVDVINEKGWYFLNGCKEADWDGEYTYVGAREAQ